jgi:hypothetical protein
MNFRLLSCLVCAPILQLVGAADFTPAPQRFRQEIARNFNTNDACHVKVELALALPLFVPRVAADDADDAFAADDSAMLAEFLN